MSEITKRRSVRQRVFTGGLAAFLCLGAGAAAAQTVYLNQGTDWTPDKREAFYTTDQGSRIMPLAWMQALKLPNGDGFLADGLVRYGYLPNPTSPTPGIPVGFTVAPQDNVPSIGMTCAACHTRQIDVNGTEYRVDGGPGIVDFQSFLADLSTAMETMLGSDATFDAFAVAVLGSDASDEAKQTLREEASLWQRRFGTLVERSLPDPAWGPSRLDAVSMIFNRLAGLDVGEPPDYIIADNIALADAPTRYPFLWNAARQDKTQWPGFADNGNDILGLSRNLGEVYGVFAIFHPTEQSGLLRLNRDYLANNSANFTGLRALETLIWDIGPPQWPWEIDHRLAATGAQIFDRDTASGGCVDCHGITRGAFRSPFHETWATPIVDVGTDTRECAILERMVETGVMEGAVVPFGTPLKETDTAFNLLATSVIGSIIQEALPFTAVGMENATTMTTMSTQDLEARLPRDLQDLRGAFRTSRPGEGSGGIAPVPPGNGLATMSVEATTDSQPSTGCAYESRVLEGIWAAAPYLHNGSVRSLEDLLKPAAERAASFAIGPSYDLDAVGLAADQERFDYVLVTTGCDAVDNGNSRCGHEYGTTLGDQEKAALLEYLKTL